MKLRRIQLLAPLALLSLAACTVETSAAPSGGTDVDVASGTSAAAITAVPGGVLCVQITLAGTTNSTQFFPVAAGASTATLSLGALNPGPITAIAYAFAAACPSRTAPAGGATWASDAVATTLIAGQTSTISFNLHPVAAGTGSVNFEQPAIAIATNGTSTYAVLADGTVRAWGDNSKGQLGLGMAGGAYANPITVPGISDAIQIDAADAYACVVRRGGTVSCFGWFGGAPQPRQATAIAGITDVKAVSVAGTFSCALKNDGSLWCWGDLPYPPAHWSPTPAQWALGFTATAVSVGDTHTCAVSTAGDVECFGGGKGLGNGQTNGVPTNTSQLAIGARGSVAVSAGFGNSCSVRADGLALCWGGNVSGEIGNGTTAAALAPVVVGSITNATGIAVTYTHTCAVTGDGAVYCWGNNSDGQLGTGNADSTTTPRLVPSVTHAVEIVTAGNMSCARTYDGDVYCWGLNSSGQLGDGTTTTRFAPVSVAAW